MKLIEHIFQILAPDECIVCGSEGPMLCTSCASVNLQDVPSRCYRCFRQTPSYKICQVCRYHSVLNQVWVRSEYSQAAKDLVYKLKFNFTKSAARVIAREIFSTLPALPNNTIVVHVPAATSHMRQRGFDQSAVIARELAALLSLPHLHALGRIGQQRQVGSSAEVRKTQMKHAYRPLSAAAVKNANILLVDDVLTTGSTLEAAGLTLKKAGAASISAAVFAQVHR